MLGAEAAAMLIDGDGDEPIAKLFLKGAVLCQRTISRDDEVEMDAAVADMAEIASKRLGLRQIFSRRLPKVIPFSEKGITGQGSCA